MSSRFTHLTRTTLGASALLLVLAASPAFAQLAARPVDEWIALLDAPARIAALHVDAIVDRLRLEPGDVVADLGAGTGVFSVPLARAVGATGKVYAVEIEQAMVDHIRRKAREQNAPNVTAILGTFGDPALPARDVDVAFMHDVLHHVQDRTGYLAQVVRYLKPGGRVVIIELDAEKGSHRDDPKLHVTKAQLRAWMAALGFAASEEADLSPEKWYAAFSRTPGAP